MKARKLPLSGKHYGTVIEVKHPAYDHMITFTVWTPVGDPSAEEVESWGHGPDAWEENILVEDGWGLESELIPIRDADYICDSHYQSAIEARICDDIVEALNADR